MKYIDFTVAPYVLYDVLKALNSSVKENEYQKIVVTGEDNDLMVRVHREYLPISNPQSAIKEEK